MWIRREKNNETFEGAELCSEPTYDATGWIVFWCLDMGCVWEKCLGIDWFEEVTLQN